MRSDRPRHLVAALVGQQVASFELSVPVEVFGVDRSDIVDPWYELRVCAVDEPPLVTSDGSYSISTPHRIPDAADADTLVIPAWHDPDRRPPEPMLDLLRDAHACGTRILSVCSGAFVLGYAGLLDGRRATTHWNYTDRLTARFPEVEVDRDVLYVVDGNVMTSAGTAAGIDLCLHVVRLDHGAEVANAVARRMVVPPHRDGGQAQFVEAPVATSAGDDPLNAVLDWLVEHLDETVTVESLARRAAMSPRTFARRFRQVTGTTPHQWLLRQRVLLAQRLLETTDEPVERIASRCGFGSAAALRAHFTRYVATPPLRYRRTFSGDRAVAG